MSQFFGDFEPKSDQNLTEMDGFFLSFMLGMVFDLVLVEDCVVWILKKCFCGIGKGSVEWR